MMPPADPRGQHGSFTRGADRLPAAAGRAARERERLRASEAAIASEVIEFQLARQRVGLRSVEELPPLSPREREVLELVAEGRSDGEVAERLFISKKTASVHVANIKGKLGAASRVEIAMLAARLGLVDRAVPAGPPEAARSSGRTRAVCPFKGLASFDVSDARFFFGREQTVAELVARLAGSTFLGVVGPSGSGKSSIVRAGLVAAFADEVLPGSDRWAVALIRPGATPLAVLRRAAAAALRRQGYDPGDGGLEDQLDVLPPGARLLLVVDQFEEAFTVCEDDTEREAFVHAIASLARDPGSRALVVLAVRADFYGRCATYPELAGLLAASHVLVGPMTADELARAIDLPARAAGLRVEPELTRALVDDVRDEPGALPLLSTTLLDLWLRRDGRTMRLAAYERLGGVSASVARLAESAIEGLARDQVQLARGILLRLATRPEDGPAVRRPVALASLDVHREPAVAAVLDRLIEHRLVTVDQGSVEIAHEVLLHAWPRLRAWLQEDAEGGRLRARLARATADWVAGGEDPAELYRGARLTAMLEWAADRDAELNETERRFLAEGRLAGEREVERQRRANTRLRRLLAGVVLLLVMALGAGVLAATQLVRAEHQSELAQARALAASAVAALDTDPGLAKLLALSAAEVDPSIETLAVLHQAFAADAVIDRYQWPADRTGGQLWTDLDPDGRRIAAAGTFYGPSDHLELVDLTTDEVLWAYPGTATPVAVGPAFFSRDGRTVVGGVASGAGETRPDAGAVGAFVWDAQTGEELRHLSLGQCGGYVTDISDTHLLAVVRSRDLAAQPCATLDPRAETALVLVELASGRMTTVTERILTDDLDGPGALSGDGRLMAFDDQAGASPGLVVAEVETGRRILELPEAQAPGFVRGLSEDGSLLLVGDRPLLVLDVSDGNGPPRAAFAGHEGASYFADFGSSGTTVYSTGRDATLRIWDGATGEEHSSFRAVGGGRAAASRDGTVVLVADPESAAAAVVDTRPRAEVAVVDTCRAVFVSATTLHVADGLAVFQETCDDDPEYNGVTQVIDLETRALRYSLAGWEGQALAVSPDGRLFLRQEYRAPIVGPLAIRELATGDLVRELDGLCRWDFNRARLEGRVATGECEPFPTSPFPIHVLSARWSPDGAMIVATDHHDADGFVAVWRASDGALLYRSPTAGGVRAFDAIFTPDSRHLVVSFFGTGRLQAIRTDTWEPVASADPANATDAGDGRLGLIGFTPDASSLVAVGGYLGTGGGSLHWLDPATLRPRRTPVTEAHDGSPKTAGLDPTGQWLATGASDGVVRVWDAATGALVHEARLTGTEVQGVAFTGAWELVILPTSGHLLVDTMHPVRLIEAVRASITRGPTIQECARYGIAPCPTLETLRGG